MAAGSIDVLVGDNTLGSDVIDSAESSPKMLFRRSNSEAETFVGDPFLN